MNRPEIDDEKRARILALALRCPKCKRISVGQVKELEKKGCSSKGSVYCWRILPGMPEQSLFDPMELTCILCNGPAIAFARRVVIDKNKPAQTESFTWCRCCSHKGCPHRKELQR